MNAEIISIGDELLIGQVVNTNASYISRELNAIGIGVRQVTTIGDDMRTILGSFRAAWKKNDVVVVTGGLGPTHDDISKAAVARFFQKDLILHAPTLRHVEARFKKYGYTKMPAANVGQAMIPRGFTVLENQKGTAPGLLFREAKKTFIILPGVPSEMEWLMVSGVIPALKRAYKSGLEVIRHRTILTTGIGESLLAEKIGDPTTFLPKETSLAFLPRNGAVRLRITARGAKREKVEASIAAVEKHIKSRAARWIYGADNDTLESNIIGLLKSAGKTVSTAESCTGGLLGGRLTEIAGSSAAFIGGVISYDNEVKIKQLGVHQATLSKHGAVSEEVAKEMATGALRKLGSDYALSVTGIAGPDGGSKDKPVGTVWIGLAERGSPAVARRFQFAGDRSLNRERAVNTALEMLRKRITGEE